MEIENKEENNDLKEVCDDIFYSGANDLTGCIGVKNLATMMEMSDEEFEDYLNEL